MFVHLEINYNTHGQYGLEEDEESIWSLPKTYLYPLASRVADPFEEESTNGLLDIKYLRQ